MFHHHCRTMSGHRRGSADIAVGDWVRSRFRAPWYGVIESLDPNNGCATVRQVLSRRGGPIRKPKAVVLHVDWLRKTEPPEKH